MVKHQDVFFFIRTSEPAICADIQVGKVLQDTLRQNQTLRWYG